MGRLLLAALVVALAWTGSARAATGILAVGDFGVGGTAERDMGAAMRGFESTHPAAMLLTLGDNDYTESPTAFHSNWTASFGWLGGAGLSVTGTLGNHELWANHPGWDDYAYAGTVIDVLLAEDSTAIPWSPSSTRSASIIIE